MSGLWKNHPPSIRITDVILFSYILSHISYKGNNISSKDGGWFVWFSVSVSLCVFPLVLHSFKIRHLTLSVSRMMCPTMSFIGFWENDADVSMFWVRPVECSLKHVTLWDAARAVRTMSLLRAQCRLFGAHTVGFLTKDSTWPDAWYQKYLMKHITFICIILMQLKLNTVVIWRVFIQEKCTFALVVLHL